MKIYQQASFGAIIAQSEAFNFLFQCQKYLGKHLDMTMLQGIAAQHWKPYMNDTNIVSCDAICSESYVCFPTPIKIAWHSCNIVYTSLQAYRKQLKQRSSRCNNDKFKTQFLSY